MPPFAAQLARLRVAAITGRLPRDLGRWAVAVLTDRAEDVERREMRDALLREAAALLLPNGSTFARARALREELLALDRRRDSSGEIRKRLADAIEIDPDCPRSLRQLLRILTSDMEPPCDVTKSLDGIET